jgi:hypothetical protein
MNGHMHIHVIVCMSPATLFYILQDIILADNIRYVTSHHCFSARVDGRLSGLH